jgi:hypothetical protein
MIFDGDEISAGDLVFDTIRGEGVVRELTLFPPLAVVEFRTGLRFAYNDQGVSSNGHKTLFWSTPVVFTPPKSARTSPNKAMFDRIVANLAGELL